MIPLFHHKESPCAPKDQRALEFYGLIGLVLMGFMFWGARFFLAVFFTGTLFSLRELARAMGYGRNVALSAAFIFATAIVPCAAAGGRRTQTRGPRVSSP